MRLSIISRNSEGLFASVFPNFSLKSLHETKVQKSWKYIITISRPDNYSINLGLSFYMWHLSLTFVFHFMQLKGFRLQTARNY